MTIEANLSDASDDDIAALASRCLEALDLRQRVQAVMAAFHTREDRDELASWIRDEPEEPDEEDLEEDEE